ncbi:MAG: DUF190 domain-containing protein [Acidimicrobiales bacterium]
MDLSGRADRLTVFVEETDHYHHHPLYAEIIQRARKAGLAGATAVRGVEGFGASTVLHDSHALRLAETLPVIIFIVDRPERIDDFLPELDEILQEGLVVRDPVEVRIYRGAGRE